LPYLAQGPLLHAARQLSAPILLSANAFSTWRMIDGIRCWARFRTTHLGLLQGMTTYLDSAGFVAMRRYRSYPWSIRDYLELCAAHPWRGFFAPDYCVEAEIAHGASEVLDRISMTVSSYRETHRLAERMGIADRLIPVVQGATPADYRRCLERLPIDLNAMPLLGVGSVCRRALHGPNGIRAIVEELDDALGDAPVKLHLFGAKSESLAALRMHTRIGSADSQAYGVTARQLALRGGFSKSNAYLADIMTAWYTKQIEALNAPVSAETASQRALGFATTDPVNGEYDARINRAREEIRELVESGEIDSHWLHDEYVVGWAFDADDDDDAIEPAISEAA
jgi:hypothetical protein